MEDKIETIMEFGIALVERQHQFFVDERIDNSEHVTAIKRIADTAYGYLQGKGASLDKAKKAKKELLNRGRDLFVEMWMTPLKEDDEPLDEEDRREAKREFDDLLKGE